MSAWREQVMEAAHTLPAEWAVVAVAVLPVLELRGAIPLGIGLGLPPLKTMLLAYVGTLLPVPVLLALLDPLRRVLRRHALTERLVAWNERRTRERSERLRRYGWFGLVLFVAVPFPTTGAWTGALAAVLLGYRFRTALAAIATGTACAGVLVTALSVLGFYTLSP